MHISGTPRGYAYTPGFLRSDYQHILARSLEGELLEWYWTPRDGWRMVNLSTAVAGGQLIKSDPRGHVFQGDQFIVARNLNNELLVWHWDGNSWRVGNLSAPSLGGRLITGTPHGYIHWYQIPPDDASPPFYSWTQHVMARSPNDELLEWWWDGQWQEVVNLSDAVGGQRIRSDPYGYKSSDAQRVVARGPNDELLEWHWTPRGSWRVGNLSAPELGGRLIAGTPQGYTFRATRHIMARSPNNELLEWWWDGGQWQEVVSLSDAVAGGQLISGDPYGYRLGDTQHVVARGRNNELLEWYWTPRDGWRVVDLSAAVGGTLIQSDPQGYTLWDDEEEWSTQHVVARGYNDELLEWYWTPRDGWRLNTFGSTRGQWIEAVLSTMMK